MCVRACVCAHYSFLYSSILSLYFYLYCIHARHTISIHCAISIDASDLLFLFFVVKIIVFISLASNRYLCAMCEHFLLFGFFLHSFMSVGGGGGSLNAKRNNNEKKKEVTKVNKQMYDKYWLEILRLLFVAVAVVYCCCFLYLHKASKARLLYSNMLLHLIILTSI